MACRKLSPTIDIAAGQVEKVLSQASLACRKAPIPQMQHSTLLYLSLGPLSDPKITLPPISGRMLD